MNTIGKLGRGGPRSFSKAPLVARGIPALLVLTALIPSAGFTQQLTAEQILAKVSETYRNLQSFNFAVGREPWTGGLTGTTPGKIRLRAPAMLLVSNGDTTWTYLPELNEYTEVAAALLWQEDWDASRSVWLSSDIFRVTLRPFRYEWTTLPPQKGHAKLAGEAKLNVGGKEVNCAVVRCSIDGIPHKLWVDEGSFLVWRDEWLSAPDTRDEGLESYPHAGEVGVWELRGANLGPMPDYAFVFTPPMGAKRVESFGPPKGYGQVWEERAAYSLLGIDTDRKVKGKSPPDFAADDVDGRSVSLRELEGKIVVLYFWASWCRPCQKDLADTQKLRDALDHNDVAFLGIDDEDAAIVKSSFKASGYKFPMLLDPNQTVHHLYAVRWTPFTVVIDRKGKVAARYVGARGEAGLQSALESAGLSAKTAGNSR